MYQRRPRRFRRRSNNRRHMSRDNGDVQGRLITNPFSNGQQRNNFRSTLSAEKLFEKYSTLSKEAMSSGDKILSENYLQHADHFMRIIEDRNRNQDKNKVQLIDKPAVDDKYLSETSGDNQDQTIKNK